MIVVPVADHDVVDLFESGFLRSLVNAFRIAPADAEATRRAARAWGLDIVAQDPKEYSPALTAVYTPTGHSADEFRKTVLEHFNMPLGTGLGRLQDKIFRIGHLGDFNDLMLAGTLSGVEMGLELAGIPHHKGGIAAAMEYLVETAKPMHVTV